MLKFFFSIAVLLALNSATVRADDEVLPTTAAGVQPALVGVEMPAAQLVAASGEAFDLEGALAAKPSVIIFYRGSW